MALILNIDTALDTACISLAENDNVIQFAANERQGDHASWIQPAIHNLIHESGVHLQSIEAIGVSIGPGSYTGLRIGLSTAKGLCYALRIPLITVGTLKTMAFGAIAEQEASKSDISSPDDLLFCPMIDARRMEVFTAVYDSNLNEVVRPLSLILAPYSFDELLTGSKILFLGNGSIKFQAISQNAHAMFKNIALKPFALATLTYKSFIGNNFAGLAYTEPLYTKEFFTKEDEAGDRNKTRVLREDLGRN
jgi:tRNA threonylcarbamoyladenosine biosynthesis protein TsaB